MPIEAVLPTDREGLRILTILSGAVLLVVGTPNVSGLVDAQWEAMLVSVYMRDVIANGELIKTEPTERIYSSFVFTSRRRPDHSEAHSDACGHDYHFIRRSPLGVKLREGIINVHAMPKLYSGCAVLDHAG